MLKSLFLLRDISSCGIQDEESTLDCNLGILEQILLGKIGKAPRDAVLLLFHGLPLNSVSHILLSLQMGYEKVDYVIKLLENNPIFKEFVFRPKKIKSNEQSEKLRISGNKLYRDRSYGDAFKYYTRSIAFAENGSLYLAKAYGNRSAVLFERRYYQEAIKDIEKSLCCECPRAVEEKLLIRKNKAKSLINQQKNINFCSYFPQIQHAHPKIDAASSSIGIRQNSKVGRYVIATENIKFGEVISVEKPYAKQIRHNSKELYCDECLQLCFNLIPCQNCATTLYCSEECLQKAFKTHHKYGCEIPDCEEMNLSLKTFLIGQSEKKVEELDDHYRSDRFKEIIKLSSNESTMNPLNILFHTIITATCFLSLKHRTNFFEHHIISEKEAKDLLYKLAIMLPTNRFGVQSLANNEIYASAIFSFNSLFNHSCASNCQFFFHGDNMVIRAMNDIKAGQECNLSYNGCEYAFTSTSERQRILFDAYHFKCTCKACEQNWYVTLAELQQLPCTRLTHQTEYRFKDGNNAENVQKLINDVGPTVNFWANRQPSIEFLYLKNVLTSMFQYAGNQSFSFSDF